MKNSIYILLFTGVIISCNQKLKTEKSLFFENCECDKIDLTQGITIFDTLNHYKIKFPNDNWIPTLSLDQNNSGITGGDTITGSLRFVAITETKSMSSNNAKKQQNGVKNTFDVLESGKVDYKGKKCNWDLVKFEKNKINPVGMYSLYITLNQSPKNRIYTINLSVEQGKDYKKRICALESFLKELEIVK